MILHCNFQWKFWSTTFWGSLFSDPDCIASMTSINEQLLGYDTYIIYIYRWKWCPKHMSIHHQDWGNIFFWWTLVPHVWKHLENCRKYGGKIFQRVAQIPIFDGCRSKIYHGTYYKYSSINVHEYIIGCKWQKYLTINWYVEDMAPGVLPVLPSRKETHAMRGRSSCVLPTPPRWHESHRWRRKTGGNPYSMISMFMSLIALKMCVAFWKHSIILTCTYQHLDENASIYLYVDAILMA